MVQRLFLSIKLSDKRRQLYKGSSALPHAARVLVHRHYYRVVRGRVSAPSSRVISVVNPFAEDQSIMNNVGQVYSCFYRTFIAFAAALLIKKIKKWLSDPSNISTILSVQQPQTLVKCDARQSTYRC